jgi:hypothetical protein
MLEFSGHDRRIGVANHRYVGLITSVSDFQSRRPQGTQIRSPVMRNYLQLATSNADPGVEDIRIQHTEIRRDRGLNCNIPTQPSLSGPKEVTNWSGRQ